MQKLFFRVLTVSLAIVFFTLPLVSSAQEALQLDVDIAVICEEVANLEPIGAGESFPVSVGELKCFTRVIGAHEPTTVTHVWYFGMTERGRVELVIKGSQWRTYSSKKIQAHEVGSWRVEVIDTEGTVLAVLQFKTTSGQEAAEAQEEEPLQKTTTPDQPVPAEEPNPPAPPADLTEQPAE